MDELKHQISTYTPQTQREKSDQALILKCIESFPNVLTRDNSICHLTASNWIINPSRSKALMAYHNINQIWMWTGGHADGESDLLSVALREANEETSLKNIRPLSNKIFSLEVFSVPPHIRKGNFVSAHLHLNCSFLLEADEHEPFKIKPDENSGIRWMDLDEIATESNNGKMSPHYASLVERTRNLPI